MESGPVSRAESPVCSVPAVLMESLGARRDRGVRAWVGNRDVESTAPLLPPTSACPPACPPPAPPAAILSSEERSSAAQLLAGVVRSIWSWRICARRSRILARASISRAPFFTVEVGDSDRLGNCRRAGDSSDAGWGDSSMAPARVKSFPRFGKSHETDRASRTPNAGPRYILWKGRGAARVHAHVTRRPARGGRPEAAGRGRSGYAGGTEEVQSCFRCWC
mmetsp:Transcript_16996/g.41968  ORF Transcript_16996/g.41968 Transcript_16996/m.41968 type:complete len:221 (-) Transcript_16996:29-691(-)